MCPTSATMFAILISNMIAAPTGTAAERYAMLISRLTIDVFDEMLVNHPPYHNRPRDTVARIASSTISQHFASTWFDFGRRMSA